jgi:hypothetical protein
MRVSLEIDAHGRVALSIPSYSINVELSVQVNPAPASTALEE